MDFQHMAMSCRDKEEINGFYIDVLGFELEKSFEINNELSARIFHIDKSADVFLLKNGNVRLEVFLNREDQQPTYRHICISVNEREKIVEYARQKNYTVERIERDKFDLIFIRDNSGNIFEVKQA
ncbi:MAG: VOC family protein [Bacteroidales bacterium]|nr:VOC family protein [Bacteroidales bacterium]MCF8388249.1 VOC family protein [Bacteroidales bacterium]MCF8398987.1 VOC family protein [Bacteroidales bacterium]